MIVTVTPNSTVDKTYTVEDFSSNRIYRPSVTKTTAGGKGINVARMLGTLGRDAIATGFLGGHNGGIIAEALDGEGICHDFVRTTGESRVCVKVVDPINLTQTEINEAGPEITRDEVETLHGKIAALLTGAEYLVLSGSAPPGVPDDFYAEAIRRAKAAGVASVLDSSGALFAQGIAAAPDIAKPNIAELAEYTGRSLETREDALEAARSLIKLGVRIVLVSMGRDGAIVTDGSGAWHAEPPEIKFVSAVGSGDSLVAAFIDALLAGKTLAEAAAAGTAAGAGNAMTHGAAFCTLECYGKLLPQVSITRIA